MLLSAAAAAVVFDKNSKSLNYFFADSYQVNGCHVRGAGGLAQRSSQSDCDSTGIWVQFWSFLKSEDLIQDVRMIVKKKQ